MPDLYVNSGAPRNLGREDWVFRDFRWVRDTQAHKGDVYPATPIEVLQFAHKLSRVEEQAYPPIPKAAGSGEGNAGEVEDADPSGDHATAVSDDAEPAPSPDDDEGPDLVNIDLYRIGDSDIYELPNGEEVEGRTAALEALGVESDGD